jgi:hypothetical protein
MPSQSHPLILDVHFSRVDDETIRLWDVRRGRCLQTLRPVGFYAGMNIAGTTGLTDAQQSAHKALGVVEHRLHPLFPSSL